MQTTISQFDAARHVSNGRAQKVYVIGPHLLDCSLPYDLWTHEAELAAAVYVLMQQPDLDASVALPAIIDAYNRSNAVAGVATRRFHATRTEFAICVTRHFIDLAPTGSYPAGIYAGLLGSPLAMPEFALNFYTSARLASEFAFCNVLEPDLLPLTKDTLAAHLWQACA